MTDRDKAGQRATSFFDELWAQGDFWALESSPFERAKYDRQEALLRDRRYGAALELGCGAGAFTRRLAPLADRIVGIDVSAAAIARAREAGSGAGPIEFRVANIMELQADIGGPWDLIVMSETIYYLGWLYSFFDVGWLAMRLLEATRPGGRFLMGNTLGAAAGHLLLPPLIRTYRDLFVNAGFRLSREEVFCGSKDGVPLEALLSLFERPADAA